MITFQMKGDFRHSENFFNRILKRDLAHRLDPFARQGVIALQDNTPVDSGLTAESWDYVIKRSRDSVKIIWTNSNVKDGVPIAVIIQYGHATGGGGYVEGIDYINPALKPIFKDIADSVWKEVTEG